MQQFKTVTLAPTPTSEDAEKYKEFIAKEAPEMKDTKSDSKDGTYLKTAASVVCSVVLLMNM